MARIMILDPTAEPVATQLDPGPDAGPLEGRTVGIRTDRAWRSFLWTADEWTTALEERGAKVRPWVAGNRIGDQGVRTAAELEDFVSGVDVAVVGLGN